MYKAASAAFFTAAKDGSGPAVDVTKGARTIEDTQAYVEEKKLKVFLQELLSDLVVEQPEDHLGYLISKLSA